MTEIKIDNGKKSRRLLRVVQEQISLPSETTGWATGRLTLGAEDLDSLYKADLYFNVATEDNDKVLRGRLEPQFMGEPHELLKPFMLEGNKTRVSGIGWTKVDSTCTMFYHVSMQLNHSNYIQVKVQTFIGHSIYRHRTLNNEQ